MIELLQMWALVEILGLICLPLTTTVLHNLPDRGWAFSKTLGMALLAFMVWLPLMYLRFLPFSQLFIAGAGVVLLALNVAGFMRMRQKLFKTIRVNLGYILISEAIFLGMVFLLGWLRSYGPDIRSYEMFMDEGFIAGIMRSPHLPPSDMWFAGYSINYYYYAHLTIAILAKLLNQSPSIAFNTGICIFFGLTAVNLFGVTCNIVSWARYQRKSAKDIAIERPDTVHPPLLRSIPFGLCSILMGLILGNLAATQQWWQNHGNSTPFDWFAPSRVIDKTINEFPAFSFLLSCFHAHVLALAFTIFAIGLAFNLFLEPEGKGLHVFGRGWRLPLTLGVTALVLGGLFTMNGWDYPTYMALALVCIICQQWLAYRPDYNLGLLIDILLASISLLALSFIFYIPFYLNFISPSQGIGLVGGGDRSQLRDVLLIYGLFAFLYLSLLLASAMRKPDGAAQGQDQKRWEKVDYLLIGLFVILGVLILLFVPNSLTFVIVASVALLGVVLTFSMIGDRAQAFTLFLGATAFGLIAVCEIFFLKDVFADSYPRMNTVFKFYFQAWALLSIACGAGLYFIVESLRPTEAASAVWRGILRVVAGGWGIALLVIVLASAVYPLVAPSARYAQLISSTPGFTLQRSDSLDGMTYLKTDPAYPGDYAAIRWLNTNIQGDPVIIEAIGPDYSNYGRISAFTGLPAPMGWVGHEYQWRVNWLNNSLNMVEFQRRSTDVDTIYSDPDANSVLSTMGRYHARYLYVGALEYAKYPSADLHRFGAFMQVVYNAGGVTIYATKA